MVQYAREQLGIATGHYARISYDQSQGAISCEGR